MTERAEGFWWVRTTAWRVCEVEGGRVLWTGMGEGCSVDEPSIEWGPYLGKEPGYVPTIGDASVWRELSAKAHGGFPASFYEPAEHGIPKATVPADLSELARRNPDLEQAMSWAHAWDQALEDGLVTRGGPPLYEMTFTPLGEQLRTFASVLRGEGESVCFDVKPEAVHKGEEPWSSRSCSVSGCTEPVPYGASMWCQRHAPRCD